MDPEELQSAEAEEPQATTDPDPTREVDDDTGELPTNAEAPDEAPAAEADAEDAADEAGRQEHGPVRDDGREWYAVHSYSGSENKVKRNLEQRIESMGMQDKIFRVVVPTEEEVEIRDGQRRTSRRRVFPGYILVEMIMDDESWYVVRNTPGVTGFVGSGVRPTPLTEEEVQTILRRMESEQPRIRVSFREGETVRITDGPFADFMAVVDDIYPDRGKVRVLVSFFGRETPVEMDFMQVERI